MYQIVNHFFPFKASVVKKWKVTDSDITRSFAYDSEDRFMATWLGEQKLDSQCVELLEIAREIYETFSTGSKNCRLRNTRLRIGTPVGGKSSGVSLKQGWRRIGLS